MFFSPTSFWNQRLPADAPIDTNSANFVSQLADVGNSHNFNYRDWGTPIFIASATDPTVSFTIDRPSVDKDPYPDMATVISAVPMPSNARPVGPWPGDNHMVIYQPSSDTLWEFWRASKYEVDGAHSDSTSAGATSLTAAGWHCESAMGIQNVSKNQGFWDNTSWSGITGHHFSAPASGLPLAGAVITIAEAQRLPPEWGPE